MTGVAYSALQQRQAALIMKGLQGSVFVADYTASAITALTDTDKLLKALPTGYTDVGWTNEKGAQFSRKVDTSDIGAWGSLEPVRSDVTGDVTTLKIECLETKKATIGLYIGNDMSVVTQDTTSGEVAIAKPARPGFQYHRVLAIAVDTTDSGEYYIARFLPRARVTDYDDQAYQSNDDSPVTYGVTFTGFTDSTLGYSEKYFYGGAGWAAQLIAMGFHALGSS